MGLISGDLCSRFCNGRNGNNGKQWRHWCATCNDKTCVYKKKSEIQLDRSNKINDFEMYESLHLKVGDNIHCIQLERDLWKVYLKTRESRLLLVVEGFVFRNISFRSGLWFEPLFNWNYWSGRQSAQSDNMWIATVRRRQRSVWNARQIWNQQKKWNEIWKHKTSHHTSYDQRPEWV